MEDNFNQKEAFISAYDQYSQAIFRYCMFRVFDRERAKELMQESFAKTWEYLMEGNSVENYRAFLYKVAHNLCVNEVIRKRPYSLDKMKEDSGFDLEDGGTRTPEEATELGMMLASLKMLNSGERDILTMRYVDDLKVSEIAEILNALPNTVSVRISRAENALKKLYKKDGK